MSLTSEIGSVKVVKICLSVPQARHGMMVFILQRHKIKKILIEILSGLYVVKK